MSPFSGSLEHLGELRIRTVLIGALCTFQDHKDQQDQTTDKGNKGKSGFFHIVGFATSAQQYVWDKVIGTKTKQKGPAFYCDRDNCPFGSARAKTRSGKTPTALDRPRSPAPKRRKSSLPRDRKCSSLAP